MSIEGFRHLVRPLLTLSGWGVVLFLALTDKIPAGEVLTPVAMMVSFWFGTRTTPPPPNGALPEAPPAPPPA